MTWAMLEQVAKTVGWVTAAVAVVFLAGVIWQKIKRGELGDTRLSPLQQIAQDLLILTRKSEEGFARMETQIGRQYTDVAQQVLAHHTTIKELTKLHENEYARLCGENGFLYSRQMVDQKFSESERERKILRDELAILKGQWFRNHTDND